eukprot:scaffold1046_cov189-Prasinococcus_capsulatus_cf.AAC.3
MKPISRSRRRSVLIRSALSSSYRFDHTSRKVKLVRPLPRWWTRSYTCSTSRILRGHSSSLLASQMHPAATRCGAPRAHALRQRRGNGRRAGHGARGRAHLDVELGHGLLAVEAVEQHLARGHRNLRPARGARRWELSARAGVARPASMREAYSRRRMPPC